MKRVLLRIAIMAGGTAAALAAVALYYTWVARAYYATHRSSQEGAHWVADSELGFTPAKDLSFYSEGPPAFTTVTDARGARISAGDPSPRRGTILAAGCSFTFGYGVNADDAFPAKLSKRLGKEVYNVGVPGYGTLGSFLRSRRFADLHPRAVVYALIEDHLERNIHPCARANGIWCRSVPRVELGPHILPPAGEGEEFRHMREIDGAHEFGWRDVLWAWRRDWIRSLGGDGSGRNEAAVRALPAGFAKEALLFSLSAWEEEAEKEGYGLFVAFVPDLRAPQPPSSAISDAVAALAGRPRFHFVNTTPLFLAYRGKESLCVSDRDCHPSPAAHEVIAQALAAAMKAASRY